MKRQEIQSFGEVFNGKTPSKEEKRSSGRPILKIRDIDEAGRFRGVFESFVDDAFYNRHAKKRLKYGDTIILNAAHNADYVGSKRAFVLDDLNGVIATGEWLIVRVKDASSNYVNHYLKSPTGRKSLKNCVKGIHLYPKDVERISVPLPPLDDQIRIAHLLGKVEGLIAQRKQHLQQLDDLLKSVFLQMFGPTSPDYEVWPLVEIRELAAKHKGAMRTGPFGSNLLHSEFMLEGDVAVLGIDNAVENRFTWGERRFISNEKYQELQNYRIFPGDVIVTIMGTIGRSAVIPDNIPVCINTKHLAAITLNRAIANPLFLSYSIHSSPYVFKQFARKNRGAIMSGLNLGLIKETKIKRAPIGLQDRFAEIHKNVDHLKSRYQQSLTELESLYGALSQLAFKGELDLSRVPLPKPATLVINLAPAPAKSFVPEPVVHVEPSFVLPDSAHLQAVLDNAEARKALIAEWLQAYCAQLGGRAFSAQQFIGLAQGRLAELHPDNDFELDDGDYEQIKAWVFEALADGTLTQTCDDAGNCIELKAAIERRPA
jgi:type I restriction enzyme S subunit